MLNHAVNKHVSCFQNPFNALVVFRPCARVLSMSYFVLWRLSTYSAYSASFECTPSLSVNFAPTTNLWLVRSRNVRGFLPPNFIHDCFATYLPSPLLFRLSLSRFYSWTWTVTMHVNSNCFMSSISSTDNSAHASFCYPIVHTTSSWHHVILLIGRVRPPFDFELQYARPVLIITVSAELPCSQYQ